MRERHLFSLDRVMILVAAILRNTCSGIDKLRDFELADQMTKHFRPSPTFLKLDYLLTLILQRCMQIRPSIDQVSLQVMSNCESWFPPFYGLFLTMKFDSFCHRFKDFLTTLLHRVTMWMVDHRKH